MITSVNYAPFHPFAYLPPEASPKNLQLELGRGYPPNRLKAPQRNSDS
jgi:hypothetical protein